MRKFLLRKILLLSLIFTTIISCEINDFNAVRIFTPEITYNDIIVKEGTKFEAYISRNLELRVNLHNQASSNAPEDYSIKVVERECASSTPMTFANSGQVIQYKEVVNYHSIVENDFLLFTIKPQTVGNYIYEVEISYRGITKSVTVSFTATKPMYDVDFSSVATAITDSLELERPREFNFAISAPNGKGTTKSTTPAKVKVSYTFKKGAGKLTYRNATTKSGTGEPAEIAELVEGDNALLLTSTQFGDNDVELTLTNEQGFTQTETIRVKAKKPEFVVKSQKIRSFALTGSKYAVQVDVDNFAHPTNKKFDLTYKIVSGSPLTKGSPVDSVVISRSGIAPINGEIRDTLDVPLTDLGQQTIYVYGTDKFGSKKNDYLDVTATKSELSPSEGGEIKGKVNTALPFEVKAETGQKVVTPMTTKQLKKSESLDE